MSHRIKRFKYARKRAKYGNQKVFEYSSVLDKNVVWDSKFEKKVGDDLQWRKKAGEITNIERQVKAEIYAYGKHICDYWVDFRVTHKDGTIEWIEAKGFPTPEWKLKWKLFEAMMNAEHPDQLLTIIVK